MLTRQLQFEVVLLELCERLVGIEKEPSAETMESISMLAAVLVEEQDQLRKRE